LLVGIMNLITVIIDNIVQIIEPTEAIILLLVGIMKPIKAIMELFV